MGSGDRYLVSLIAAVRLLPKCTSSKILAFIRAILQGERVSTSVHSTFRKQLLDAIMSEGNASGSSNPPMPSRAVPSLAKKQSEVTRLGGPKLKFVPTLTNRRKKE